MIGGSILGHGMESLANNTAIDLVESDVSFGPRTMLMCEHMIFPLKMDHLMG